DFPFKGLEHSPFLTDHQILETIKFYDKSFQNTFFMDPLVQKEFAQSFSQVQILSKKPYANTEASSRKMKKMINLTNENMRHKRQNPSPQTRLDPVRLFIYPHQQLSSLPHDIRKIIFQKAKEKFEKKDDKIHEFLTEMAKKKEVTDGLGICDTYNYNQQEECKGDCIIPYCECSLDYKIPRVTVDLELYMKYYPRDITHLEEVITIHTLLDFGLIECIQFRGDQNVIQRSNLGKKLKEVFHTYLLKLKGEHHSGDIWIYPYIDSKPLGWSHSKFEPT
ncbi:essential protein Yae1, partial [Striga asiatica]